MLVKTAKLETKLENYEIATIPSSCPTKIAVSYGPTKHVRGTKCFP